MTIVRRNVVAGLLLIVAGLLFGAFLAAARDFRAIEEWFRSPPVRSNQILYAHAHLGVLGLTNIALGLVLPLTSLGRRLRAVASFGALAAGVLVPAGMTLVLLPEPWTSFVYLQAAGFALLLASTAAATWGRLRARTPERRAEPARDAG